MYLQKLLNGVNPLDGTLLPPDDIVHQERIARCLQYVSEVLGQVIENGGITAVPPKDRAPFAITNEQLANYPLTEGSATISEITARINSLIDTNKMRQISAQTITGWLAAQGLLYVVTHPSGRTSKHPTENGLLCGISAEQRMGQNGEYTAIFYNSFAQRYILAHLQEIIGMQNEKRQRRSETTP